MQRLQTKKESLDSVALPTRQGCSSQPCKSFLLIIDQADLVQCNQCIFSYTFLP
jgi:hypothetical protein